MNSTQASGQSQQIVQLEEELATMREQHTKILRKEKERYEDLIQSLQLRLYISETRLRTYEDALEKHIQAVAENVGTQHHLPQSPLRRSGASSNIGTISLDEDCAPSPSLIARVLQKRSD
eukprot:CAMPEP_0178750388 /NCGR_PEP_ID=MMETSP0744-20121128/9951_1 /TAXON_ID=913974 /ORGANISM="Nitzschia punctata, Strain CCMP561" /LENGTH=119 /DNA_ID=CAMNT_0020403933 /DNA_START=1 /DNA_END=360 /DNA_ORIENTATION=-